MVHVFSDFVIWCMFIQLDDVEDYVIEGIVGCVSPFTSFDVSNGL